MDWNALKLFLAITKQGSLTGAAKQLAVNHSTVFRRLNNFETELGGRLFERLNNGYELTALGHEILQLAENIENSFDTLERRIIGKDLKPQGVVKITAPNNIAYRYLPRYLTAFNILYPDIHIELLVSNETFNMSNRQADIAIRATNSVPEHLVGRKVADVTWGVFASQRYLENHRCLPQSINELTQHALVGGTGNMRNLSAFRWLEKHHSQQIVTRCDELMTMSRFAESGHALAFLPEDQHSPEIQKLFTFAPGGYSNLWLLTHPDIRNVARIKLIMQYLTKAFAEEPVFKTNQVTTH